ncbi:MAG TPA: c-type cytochrome domain-containing protein, partial [Verrucomicrobiae bacterium]|nr:c-type cytochrome domain-containing protein [Verrucomicrobiae bacterium]
MAVAAIGARPQAVLASPVSSPASEMVNQYCAECHDSEMKKGGLDLDSLRLEDVTKHPEVWEKVVRKLRARQMPPMEKPRPEESAYEKVVARLSDALDRAAAEHPNPGRTETFRR